MFLSFSSLQFISLSSCHVKCFDIRYVILEVYCIVYILNFAMAEATVCWLLKMDAKDQYQDI